VARKKGKQSKAELNVCLILDESGSMGGIKESTIDSVNEYLDTLKDICANVTIATFHSDWHQGMKLTKQDYSATSDVPRLSQSNYKPDGGTPLLVAVGTVIADLTDEKTLVVVVTDGCENTSTEYSAKQIKKLIEEKSANDWQFIYLGANQDSWGEAQQYGFNKGTTYDYVATNDGMRNMTSALSMDTMCFASAGTWSGDNLSNLKTESEDKKCQKPKGKSTNS